MAQSSTPQQRHKTARTDFVPAARFELAAHVNVRQPDSQQNKNPNPRQPDATRNKAAILTAALAALIEGEWICLQSAKGVRVAMNGGRFAYLSYLSCKAFSCRQSLLNERRSRSAGDVTDEERISTCGVSGSGNVSVRHGAQAIQPVRNRSWAQTSSVATASERYASWCCRLRDFPSNRS